MNFHGLFQDWPVILPQLLVYTAGIIIALVNWSTTRVSAVLTLITMLLFIFVMFAQIPINAYLNEMSRFNGWKTPHYIHTRIALLFGIGATRSLGTILTLFAVFQARRPPPLP